MVLKPTDHLREVSCTIKDSIIKKGVVYFEKKRDRYYILQNEKNGSYPAGWSGIKEGKLATYKYSWVCQHLEEGLKLTSYQVMVKNLKFLDSKIYELW